MLFRNILLSTGRAGAAKLKQAHQAVCCEVAMLQEMEREREKKKAIHSKDKMYFVIFYTSM